MRYYYRPYDGHRELFAFTDHEQRYVCADCSIMWSPGISIDTYGLLEEKDGTRIPDSAILLLGVELL